MILLNQNLPSSWSLGNQARSAPGWNVVEAISSGKWWISSVSYVRFTLRIWKDLGVVLVNLPSISAFWWTCILPRSGYGTQRRCSNSNQVFSPNSQKLSKIKTPVSPARHQSTSVCVFCFKKKTTQRWRHVDLLRRLWRKAIPPEDTTHSTGSLAIKKTQCW